VAGMSQLINSQSQDDKEQRRFEAVLSLLKGSPVYKIVDEFKICHSDLYKFQKRALKAMRQSLKDQPRGPKRPQNRLCSDMEEKVKAICDRYPTLSSYKIQEKIGHTSPNPRTIQRVRKRLSLSRLHKRVIVKSKSKRFTSEEKLKVKNYIKGVNHLGSLRLSWDITNIMKIAISASTVLRWRKQMQEIPKVEVVSWQFYERKHPHSLWHGDILKFEEVWNNLHQVILQDDYSRGYICCELTTLVTTIYVVQCLIKAMRQWKTIPKALLFDNESIFKASLLKSFCSNLGIKIIYITVRHPQTNGKLERAFRDDQRDFYSLRTGWLIEDLQKDLPDYIYYRNYQRGHLALQGKPAITRLREQNWFALPSVLNRLEEYAVCEAGERHVDSNGYVHLLGISLYLDKKFSNSVVKCFETMNGLEIRKDNIVIGILSNYQEYRRLYNSVNSNSDNLPKQFILQRNKKAEQLHCVI
jgi:transposase InsO family protein